MSEIFERARDVAVAAGRSVLCGVSGLNRVSNDIAGKINPLYRGSALDRFRDRVSDALDRFCPVPPGEVPPPPSAGFTGGQCPGVAYRVRYLADDILREPSGVVRGPLREPTGIIPDQANPGTCVVRATGFTSGGEELSRSFGSGACDRFSNFEVYRIDGQPDDCGDPPPPPLPGPPPSNPRPPSTDIVIDLPDLGPTTVTFAPVVGIVYADVDASIRVPVTVNVSIPGVTISPSFDFDINLSDPSEPPRPIDPAPDRDEDDRPREPDCPLPPTCDESPEEEDPDEPDTDEKDEEGRVITGGLVLSVRTGGVARQTEIFMGDTPSVFVPYLGLGTFVYERPDGGLCYSADIPIKRTTQAVVAPSTGLRVVAFRCRWESGWTGEAFNVVATDCCS